MQVQQLGRVIVKGTQFLSPGEVQVDADGIRHDRAFALVESDDCFVGAPEKGRFMPLRFSYDESAEQLQLTMPDGKQIEGPAAADGRAFAVDHFGLRDIDVAEVGGPWEQTLSDFAGRSIRLVKCLSSGRAIDVFAVTFTTTGSLRKLAEQVGKEVDPLRFRAGFVLENDTPYEEDDWDGRELTVGGAKFHVRTAVPRCQVTGYHPTSGESDAAVMQTLIKHRDKVHLPDGMMPDYATPGFATYAEVVEPGSIKVGDTATLS